MIELLPNTAFMVYLGITCVFLLGLWLYHHFLTARRPRFRPQHELHLCEFCHFVYVTGENKSVTTCPQCHTLNKDNLYKNKEK